MFFFPQTVRGSVSAPGVWTHWTIYLFFSSESSSKKTGAEKTACTKSKLNKMSCHELASFPRLGVWIHYILNVSTIIISHWLRDASIMRKWLRTGGGGWITCLSQSLIGCFRQQGRHRRLQIRCQSIGQSSAAIIAKLCCFQIVWKTGFWKVKAWKASGITVHHYFVTILKRATFLGFPVHTCLSVHLFVCWFVPAWCGFILEFKNQKHDKTLKLRQ